MTSWLFAAECAKNDFFGLVPWYQYLDYGQTKLADGTKICEVKNFVVLKAGESSSMPLILLAVVDDLLRIAGLVAVAFVIYGAIKYTTSEGNPDQATAARHTIINALIGLVVAIMGVGFISFVGNSLLK